MVGLTILLTVLLASVIGSFAVNPADGIVGAVPPSQRPSAQHLPRDRLAGPRHADDHGPRHAADVEDRADRGRRRGRHRAGARAGRRVLRRLPDAGIRLIADSLMTVPGIAMLLVIAVNVGHMTVELMALTVAALSWMYPTRTIRSQVLSIRERPYVAVARANGASELQVVFQEIMPNLMPFIAASFVVAVNAAMLASIGLEALGLGANDVHTLGTTIYWAQKYSAVLRGQWWWLGPPIAMIATIFIGMFFVSVGVDRFANPRLRQQT